MPRRMTQRRTPVKQAGGRAAHVPWTRRWCRGPWSHDAGSPIALPRGKAATVLINAVPASSRSAGMRAGAQTDDRPLTAGPLIYKYSPRSRRQQRAAGPIPQKR